MDFYNKKLSRAGDCSMFLTNYLRNRELGCKLKLGSTDKFMEKLYSHLLPCAVWDHNDSLRNSAPGGIFNLEFSPDGSLLVAACEKRSILLFDPICRQLVNSVDKAHFDCVNCVRFLDSRVFATCSDDYTVALWDARNLKSRIRTLHGHSNWVKNIEYSQSDGLLVTSGFDGVIYTWDINSYTESGFLYNRVFHTNGLMRTRLTPDASKMIICTTGGFLILIHDLNLRTLANDLYGFKPNMYRLMQLSQTTIPVAASFTHLFNKRRKQNRIEFVTDFPEGDDAEVLSSLQVHPQGWCALSRNISNDETSEWTCVHDIQDFGPKDDEKETSESDESDTESSRSPPSTPSIPSTTASSHLLLNRGPRYIISSSRSGYTRGLRRQNAFRGFRGSTSPSNSTAGSSVSNVSTGGSIASSSSSAASSPLNDMNNSTDVWEALVAIREARARRQARNNDNQNNVPGERREIESHLRIVRMQSGIDGFSHPSPDVSPVERERHVYRQGSHYISLTGPPLYVLNRSRLPPTPKVPKNHKIHQNVPRLTHYIEENNVGKGFIKELCFSSDGRLICSPFGYGVRLLTFSPNCSELSSCVPKDGPVKLHELGTNISHHDIVVSTKFSPTHCLLVSGCLTGRIVWHQPVL